MEKFHVRLKRLREKQDLTMKALARKISVPESTYRDWEYGGAIQGMPYVRLAEALDVGLHELMTGAAADPNQVARALEAIERDLRELRLALRPWLEPAGLP
jgi:transcriptional regulator with XRE-family HTH domain